MQKRLDLQFKWRSELAVLEFYLLNGNSESPQDSDCAFEHEVVPITFFSLLN